MSLFASENNTSLQAVFCFVYSFCPGLTHSFTSLSIQEDRALKATGALLPEKNHGWQKKME